MRIRRIEINGFGKLQKIERNLSPEINIFFGDNETGKSTLQQAILSLLYGFHDGLRASPKENEKREKYRPWDYPVYSGSLEYALDNAKAFRIERDFASDDVPTKVIDSRLGRDITSEFGNGRHGNVPFAKQHIGLSRSIFISSSFIDQGAVTNLQDTGSIGETIVGLADTGQKDISANKAIIILDKVIKERVGTDRSFKTPLALARKKMDDTRIELNSFQTARQKIQSAAEEKEIFAQELAYVNSDLQKAKLSIILRQLEEVDDRVQRFDKQTNDKSDIEDRLEDLKKYSGFPVELHQEVIVKMESLKKAQTRLHGLQQQIAAMKSELEKDASFIEYRGLKASLEKLTDSEYAEIQKTQEQVNLKSEEINTRRQKLEKVESYRVVTKPWMIVLMILLAPLGIPLFFWYRAKEKRKLSAEKQNIIGTINMLVAEQSILVTRQETLLGRYGVKDLAGLNIARSRYFQIGVSIGEFESLTKQADIVDIEVAADKSRLLQIYKVTGIEDPDPSLAFISFKEAYNGKIQFDQLMLNLNSTRAQLTQILGKQTLVEIMQSQKNLQAERDSILANNSALTGLLVEGILEDLNSVHIALEQKKKELEENILRREEYIKTGLSMYRDGVEIEEDLSIHKAEIYKLETFRDALTLAKDKIEESANEIHHNFAPRLAIAVGRKLTVVTGGRYDMVNLDPASLHVTVKEPSINQMINVEQLSFGTKELMYLLLRVELARLMSNLHESIPLFMDDAFVNIDSSRLLKILDYMADLAKENQILFFTKDAQIVDWFHSSLSGNSLNCLFSISADGSIKEERR